jgi:hypothetical protein
VGAAVIRHELPANMPHSDGALWDVLHDLFGVGTFDETAELPWWRFRATEVSKVKASRKKHDLSIPDCYIAALYCRAHGQDIRAVNWLVRHVNKAWTWWDAKSQRLIDQPGDAYAEAVRIESNNQDPTWLNRLLRASPANREEVLAEWTMSFHPGA